MIRGFTLNLQQAQRQVDGQESLKVPCGGAVEVDSDGNEKFYVIFVRTDYESGEPVYKSNGRLCFNLKESRIRMDNDSE